MTGYSKRNEVRRDDEHHVARKRTAVDVDPLAMRPRSNGVQRNGANWAWARSGAHYDWMDHAAPFDHRD